MNLPKSCVLGLFLVLSLFLEAQSGSADTCVDAEPLCGSSVFSYPNTAFGGNAEPGPDYGCLGSQPNPAWFFLQIGQSGNISLTIEQSTVSGGTPNLDVDFILYGPFDDTVNACATDLNFSNTVDCSYLPNNVEIADIPNAVAGEFYLLLITNFSDQPGFITVTQSGGTGATNCGILADETGCTGQIVGLDATTTGADYYVWFEDDGNGNFVEITGETGAILNVTDTNIYRCEAFDINDTLLETYQFNVVFSDPPVINPLEDEVFCTSDGFTTFDLSSKNDELLGNQDPSRFTISYYSSQFEAETATNPLADNYSNPTANSTNTIYARIQNNSNTDCFNVTDFTIQVYQEALAESIPSVTICDDDNDGFWDLNLSALEMTALGSQDPGLFDVSFYLSQNDAANKLDPLSNSYTNQVAFVEEQIFYRVENSLNEDCFSINSFLFDVDASPVINPVTDQRICDDNNDGFWDLDLNMLTSVVLGSQNPADFEVTYHLSQADADSNTNPLPGTYTNATAYTAETIYIRIFTINSICYETSTFDFVVFDNAAANPAVFSLCDNNLDGDDTNGIAVFDLPLIDDAVLGGLDGSDFSVSYYRTQSDADARTNPITSPYPNTIPNSDQVVARVENNGNTDCYGTAVVDLVVEALPQISDQVELLQCDDDTDGFSVFNLEESEGLISSNFQNELFTYHESAADAEAGVNAIANPLSYTNEVAVSDRLYVRVSTGFGCHRLAELDLVVSSTQIPDDFELVYEICDGYEQDNDNTNGIASFDFSDATVQIESLFASGDVTVTYYQSIGEALEERNAITDISSYRNEASPFEQVLVVRVDSDVNNACVGLGEHIVLRTVNPQPNLDPDDIVQCDNNNPGDMSELFDLTQNEAYILGGEANVVASYHTSVEDAESGSNAISTPAAYANTSAFETIYVRVTNSITGCYARVEFDIEVDPLPEAIEVTDFVVCEDNTDGVFDFDLQSKTAEILNGQDPSIYQVSYHQSQADADNLNSALISPYTNISNPQTIYVSILNTLSGCSVSVQSFDLVIQEAAEANPDGIPIVYEICDNVNDNDGLGQFDLATQSAAILDGQDVNDFSVSYHASMEDAMNDQTPLPLLYENLSNPQVIYARVSNVVSPQECFSVAPLTLQVNLLPEIGIRDRYVLCAVTNGSEAVETPPVIDTGLSGTQYRFEWSYNGEVLPNETAPSIIATQSGEYGVFVTDIGSSTVTSCTGSASTVVIDSEPPQISAEVVSVAFSDRHDIEAMATGIGEYEYSLDNGPWQMDGLFEGVSLGVHVIRARDRNGCGTNSVEVVVMDYPKYFTPNGDGNNDLWQISGIENQPNAKIYIFDRYGKLLVQLSPTGRGWDGTYQGNLMPSDDYWFSVDYTEPTTGDPKVFKAHFTLKR
jgi:gliding motility-associated-like protein